METGSSIAIIATSGNAPYDLAHKLRLGGHHIMIIAIEDVATADFSGFDQVTLPIGAMGKAINEIKARGFDKMIFSGTLKRPPLSKIKADATGLKILTKVMMSGDDKALSIIKKAFNDAGIMVLNPSDLMPETYAEEGVLAGEEFDVHLMKSLHLGVSILMATSPFDFGQGCIVQDERVLAMEGVEGTDSLLNRTGPLIINDLGKPLFVKMMKANQDPSLDPPGFGVETIKHCHDAGITHIALEAKRVLIFDKEEVLAEAKRLQMTIIGFNVEDVIGYG